MTTKEKAEDLVNKFYIEGDMLKESHSYRLAKKCALIAVDEIIQGYEYDSLEINHKRIIDSINFWDEVKQEIENL
jgi:hypothetical protein